MSDLKKVLVTGASKGIGKAIAISSAKAGYSVDIHYGRDKVSAEKTLEEIKSFGGEGEVLSFDVGDRSACISALSEREPYYGVVLNAGIARDNAFPALEDEDWDQVINTNLNGFYNVLKPVIMPMVRQRRPGRVITMSSVSGIVGNRGQVNYSASKSGVIGATKALALELARRNITVNCVAPGLIKTQMVEDIHQDIVKNLVPMQRVGSPEEVAAVVVFLLSKEASYITRQVISVNGGLL